MRHAFKFPCPSPHRSHPLRSQPHRYHTIPLSKEADHSYYLVRSGRHLIPNGPDWKLELINVYDKGTRPVLQMSNARTNVTASFILFENNSGQPNAQGCRKDAIDPIVESQGKLISERVDGESKDPGGNPLAMTSYMTAIGDTKAKQHSIFAFAGDAKTCAEIHVSTLAGTPNEEPNLKAAIAEFDPKLGLPTHRTGLLPHRNSASTKTHPRSQPRTTNPLWTTSHQDHNSKPLAASSLISL